MTEKEIRKFAKQNYLHGKTKQETIEELKKISYRTPTFLEKSIQTIPSLKEVKKLAKQCIQNGKSKKETVEELKKTTYWSTADLEKVIENEEFLGLLKDEAKYKSSNPALTADTFKKVAQTSENVSQHMTIEGTVKKIGILAILVLIGFLFTWNLYNTYQYFKLIQTYVIVGALSAFVVALIIIYIKKTAPYLAPIYCVLEGIAIGGLSAFMEEEFPGIVVQAFILTLGVLFSLLLIYKFRIIRATKNFKLIIASATSGIAIYYLISLLGNFLGFQLPYIHENTTDGIIFSLFVTTIAALNLVIDFDFIENGVESKAPKYMEWYGAFGLMVTVIWLYLEILRLLGKLRKR